MKAPSKDIKHIHTGYENVQKLTIFWLTYLHKTLWDKQLYGTFCPLTYERINKSDLLRVVLQVVEGSNYYN